MFALLKLFSGGLTKLGGQWLSNKQAKNQAQADRKIELIRADNTVLGNLTQGIKDELWTATVLLPVWTIMCAAILNRPDVIDRVVKGFEALDRTIMPMEVWSLAVVISVVVSFGGRVKTVLDKFGWNKDK